MAVVRGIAEAAGDPVENALVEARLIAGTVTEAGFQAGGIVQAFRRTVRSDSDGEFELDLPPNAQVVPANTYYMLTITHQQYGKDKKVIYISVPTGGPHDVDDILVEPPTELEAAALTLHRLTVKDHGDWADTAPTIGQGPVWDGTQYVPGDIGTQIELNAAVTALQAYANAAVEAHRIDTTNVHGIADTALLETGAGAQAKVDAAVLVLEDADDDINAAIVALENYANATFIPLAQRGAANGVATLDAGGKVPNAQLPPLAISETYVAGSQAAMLALSAQRGDVAVRTDQSKSYILTTDDPTVLGNWQELLTPADSVTSVDGRVGVVSLSDLYAPLVHAARHSAGGADPITITNLAAAGLTAGHVLRATAGTTFAFGAIVKGDLPATVAFEDEANVFTVGVQDFGAGAGRGFKFGADAYMRGDGVTKVLLRNIADDAYGNFLAGDLRANDQFMAGAVTAIAGIYHYVINKTAGSVGFAVRAAASQSGDILQLQRSDGQVYSMFGSTGGLVLDMLNGATATTGVRFGSNGDVGLWRPSSLLLRTDASFGIGVTPAAKLHVVNTAGITALAVDGAAGQYLANFLAAGAQKAFIWSDGRMLAGAGSAGNPGLSFAVDQGSGMFSVSANVVGWSANGVERMRIDASSLTLASINILWGATGNKIESGAYLGDGTVNDLRVSAGDALMLNPGSYTYTTKPLQMNTFSTLGELSVVTGSASRIVGVFRAAASQSVDIIQVQDSAALALLKVDSVGRVGIGNTSPTYRLDVLTTYNTVGIRSGSSTAGDILYYATGTVTGDLTIFQSAASATGQINFDLINANAASASARAVFNVQVAGASVGDPLVRYTVSGVQNWSHGIDNSDGDMFKLSSHANVEGATRMSVTTAGNFGIGIVPVTGVRFAVTPEAVGDTAILVRLLASHTGNARAVQNSATQELESLSATGAWTLSDAGTAYFRLGRQPIVSDLGAGSTEVRIQTQSSGYFTFRHGGSNSMNIQSGKVNIFSELELEGILNHDGTHVGFRTIAPAPMPDPYTQTYATVTRTHANMTSNDLAAFTGGIIGFLDAAERDAVRTELNALRADVINLKGFANAMADDLQIQGLAA